MEKIGICACYNTMNYGSMLQSFATQKTVESLGYDCEFIVYKKKKTIGFILKQIPRLLNKSLIYEKMLSVRKNKMLRKNQEILNKDLRRQKEFERFQEQYYKSFSPVYYGYKELCKAAVRYSSIIVGSDQLWSPAGLATNFYNLMFVPDEVNKISYATSFGVSEIPWYQRKRTGKYLSRIQHLSVRELRGSEIVYELTGRNAEVVADPTLLLTRDEWKRVIPEKRLIEEEYIFCYFLGENQQHRIIAEKLKEESGLPIVTMPFLDTFVECDVKFGDFQLFDVGPDDFVNAIRGAKYVLTDSFHGSVFSIINHKTFITLNRYLDGEGSRNSRIDSLCEMLGLSKRRYKSDVAILEQMEQAINYDFVDEKLFDLRNKSMQFLSTSISG